MPYDPPVVQTSDTEWTVSAQYGSATTVRLAVSITVEGSATEADGDSALQDIVDALSGRVRFSNVFGQKAYRSSEARAMQPTT
ncbi:hypothetical protein [Streptomyces sp. NBC_00996]|uniref:hypothetical protein n=1 Tax=Streptomyces sp. NBC_00996 TaxID=2903710 RepID=UPI00386CE5CD|nr:hypothetical protein OG390_17165 [Streptomyces sp. NBC_00996]